jgi:hypothetical protein
MELSGTHKTMLFEESAITLEVVASRGYRTMINLARIIHEGS